MVGGVLLRPDLGYVGARQDACNLNVLLTKMVQKNRAGMRYNRLQNSVACLLGVDWNSGSAKIQWPANSMVVPHVKQVVPEKD